MKLSLEGGPAFRQTIFTDGVRDNAFAARAGGNFWWAVTPDLEITEGATLYYDSFNTSLQSLTALTATLTGALSARASFQLNTESNPPPGRKSSDTISRITLVYSF